MRKISKPQEMQVKRVNLNIPIELHHAFKAATASKGQNMTDVLMDFIQRYVARNEQKSAGRRK